MAKTAVVVGISKYKRPTPELDAPSVEANYWTNLLEGRYGFRVTPLVNADATPTNVRGALSSMLRGAGSSDECVFVFIGHGTTASIGGGMGDEAVLLFFPEGDAPSTGAFTDSDLSAIVKDANPSPDAKITSILDCCHAGGFDRDLFVAEFEGGNRRAFERNDKKLLFFPLLTFVEYESLLTVHRFGSLWNKGTEFATIDPLVVAACGRAQLAAELPSVLGQEPRTVFGSRAIPALDIPPPPPSHQALVDSINSQPSDQTAMLLGNMPRRPHEFFT